MTMLVLAFLLTAAVDGTPAPAWPAPGAALSPPTVERAKKRQRRMRVYVDAGHGAAGNPGNRSVTCEAEQDFTFRIASELATRLEATGHFRVKVSRAAGALVDYRTRLDDAAAFGAEAFVSLHSDARGSYDWWSPSEGVQCLRNDQDPGFAVLVSSEGPKRLVGRRQALARAIAKRMADTGFPAYSGFGWANRYDADAEQAGVFVDGRDHGRRLMLLRKPRVPSVIVETHHALDFEEAARWGEEKTVAAFASALGAALLDVKRGGPPPERPAMSSN